jgi:hypothetical protein
VTRPLVRDVLLLDGSTLRLRTPTPDDLDEIKRFYDRLSEESRYPRFHGYLRTEVAARAYAEANGIDRSALIGGQGDRILAAASYDLPREPGAAEVAFRRRGRVPRAGAATRMLEQLAAVAAERGVKRFDAEGEAGGADLERRARPAAGRAGARRGRSEPGQVHAGRLCRARRASARGAAPCAGARQDLVTTF